ncbi:hypothetical protein DFP72DRAFT_1122944 [Ephemerocybe angulata]|uniref:Uncharacterized protein n=1 Tax=Ephemerocybe angulata TaxID=980116 RepID=A0A8H6I0P0_9AGAR|nr:hypothetical protein DFP72DRAFT_1122944 [Tulosesus angulatus]
MQPKSSTIPSAPGDYDVPPAPSSQRSVYPTAAPRQTHRRCKRETQKGALYAGKRIKHSTVVEHRRSQGSINAAPKSKKQVLMEVPTQGNDCAGPKGPPTVHPEIKPPATRLVVPVQHAHPIHPNGHTPNRNSKERIKTSKDEGKSTARQGRLKREDYMTIQIQTHAQNQNSPTIVHLEISYGLPHLVGQHSAAHAPIVTRTNNQSTQQNNEMRGKHPNTEQRREGEAFVAWLLQVPVRTQPKSPLHSKQNQTERTNERTREYRQEGGEAEKNVGNAAGLFRSNRTKVERPTKPLPRTLPSIINLPKNNPPRSDHKLLLPKVDTIDNDGALPAQLEGHRGEMLRGRGGDDTGDAGVACVEYVGPCVRGVSFGTWYSIVGDEVEAGEEGKNGEGEGEK